MATELKANPTCPLTVVLEAIHEHEPESVRDPVHLPESIADLVIDRVLKLPGFLHLHHEDPRVDPDAPPDEDARSIVRRASEIAIATLLEAHVVTHRGGRLVTVAAYRDIVGKRDYRRVYPILFRTLATRIIFSGNPSILTFEELFGFGLLQLARIDALDAPEARPIRFSRLATDFYDALPLAREWVARSSPLMEDSEEDVVAIRYVLGMIYGFWCVLGLVDIRYSDDSDYLLTVRPLLGELVRFPREWLRAEPRSDVPDFGGLKPTKTGALPRSFAQAVGPRILSPSETYWSRYQKSIQKEAANSGP